MGKEKASKPDKTQLDTKKCGKRNGGLPGKGTRMTPERRETHLTRRLTRNVDKPLSILRRIMGWTGSANLSANLIWKDAK